ncbi:hypothetical protein KAR91_20605 [Candidatus Pacearchaeota archaeon]|nr:hypothetical protein [Candidatus Pacearchaeota archaeon]
MATNFPTALDDFTNYIDGTTIMEAVTLNDMQFAIEALEAKVLINGDVPSANDECANKKYVDDQLAAQMTPTTESAAAYSTGVTVFANGLRIARGVENIINSSTITPSGFTKIYHAQATIVEGSSTDRKSPKVEHFTDNTFRVFNPNGVSLSHSWFAIGR